MKMIAEMYRGLSPEELQKYKDMATANMTKFKEEYGEDALKQSTKKKKKKKKEEDNEDVATEVAKVSTKKDEAEESDDESESEDDGEAIPKPPASAYIDYSSFIRPKIKEENPDATPTEIVSIYSYLCFILVCLYEYCFYEINLANSNLSIQLSTHIYSSLDDTHRSSLQSIG